MARIAQPREVAELKGAHKRNPQRYRGEAVKSEQPLGNAPEHLSEGEKRCWFELEALSLPGVLTGADRVMLELACELLAKKRGWVEVPEDVPAEIAFKMRSITGVERNTLVGILARLGMSPADRQKFTRDEGKSDNPFAEF